MRGEGEVKGAEVGQKGHPMNSSQPFPQKIVEPLVNALEEPPS